MKKIIITSLVLVAFGLKAQQDKHFSLWFMNNMTVNPGSTGTNEGKVSAFLNFRNQHFTVSDNPYRTIGASIELNAYEKQNNSNIGAGLIFQNDVSGDGRYAVTEVKVPIAYQIGLNKESKLGLGLQVGMYNRSISPDAYTWDNQWTGVEFDQTINSGQNIQELSELRADIAGGINYEYEVDDLKIFGGASIAHLTRQELSFFDSDKLYRRLTINGGAKIKFYNSNFGLSPNLLMFFQGPNRNIVFGTNFDFYLQDASSRTALKSAKTFSLGTYYRAGDSFIINMMYQYSGFFVGAGFDVTASQLSDATRGAGAFELFLKYNISTRPSSRYIR